METNLDFQIRKRVYKVEGPEARDGIFVQDQEHARRLYELGQNQKMELVPGQIYKLLPIEDLYVVEKIYDKLILTSLTELSFMSITEEIKTRLVLVP